MKPPKSPNTYEIAPEGTHPAIVCQLIDKGTQQPNNPEWDPARILTIGWHLVEEKTKNGNRNIIVRSDYTFSTGSKKLKAVAKAVCGIDDKKFSDFEVTELMGKPCMVTVEHVESKSTGNLYAKVTSVTPVPKNMKVKKSNEPQVEFFLDENFDPELLESLGEKLQSEIKSSDEYNELEKAMRKPANKKAKR